MNVPWWFWLVCLGLWALIVAVVLWADSTDEAAHEAWWDDFNRRFHEKDES